MANFGIYQQYGAGIDPWPLWVQSTQGIMVTDSGVWSTWVTTTTNTTQVYPTALGQQAWNTWVNTPQATAQRSGIQMVNPGQEFPIVVSPPSEEDLWKSMQTQIILQNRERARRLRYKVATRRAEALLLEHLTEEQTKEWTEKKQFHVHTADGLRTYKIRHGVAGNVSLVKGETERVKRGRSSRVPQGSRFCCHINTHTSRGMIPTEDNVLTQKLMLEADEEGFLATANFS